MRRAERHLIGIIVAADRIKGVSGDIMLGTKRLRESCAKFIGERIICSQRARRREFAADGLHCCGQRPRVVVRPKLREFISDVDGITAADGFSLRSRQIECQCSERRGPDNFRSGDAAFVSDLKIAACGEFVGDAAAIKAGEGRALGVTAAIHAERRLDARIDTEFGQAGGQKRAIEIQREGYNFFAPGIIADDQPDIVRPLREGEIANVIGAGVQPRLLHRLPVDDRFDCRRPGEGEGSLAARLNVALRFQIGINPHDRCASHWRRARKSARNWLQVARCIACGAAEVVINQSRAFAPESVLDAGFTLQDKAAKPRCAVQDDIRRRKSRVSALVDVIGIDRRRHIGRKIR